MQRRAQACAEERIAEIWRELAVGEACSVEPTHWKITEEALLDELTELELSLLPRNAAQPEAVIGKRRCG